MKDFDNPVEAVQHAFIQMKRMRDNYSADLSTIDSAISDLYHDLERLDKLDAYTGYLYGKRFWELYRARREVKEQNDQIKSFERYFNLKNSIDNMDRAMLKVGKEMPKGKRVREYDILCSGTVKLKNGKNV